MDHFDLQNGSYTKCRFPTLFFHFGDVVGNLHIFKGPTRRVQRVRLFLCSFVLYRPWIPVAVVQPRFFSHFREVQQYFSELGLPKGMLEILPGITQARVVAQGGLCLQFTGSSAMFRGLVSKAYDLGNFGLQHVGEVCGQCQQTLLNRKQASKIYLLQCASRVSVCFCCDFGTVYDCSQGSAAAGQFD